mgnify:CR=1 FL=1
MSTPNRSSHPSILDLPAGTLSQGGLSQLAFSQLAAPVALFFGRGLRVLASLAIAATLSCAVASPAAAQFGGKSGFAEAFKPDFLNRDMSIFADMLGLEEWQRPIFEVLLQEYGDTFNAGVTAVKDRMKAATQETGGGGNVTARIMAPIDAWVAEKGRLNQEFLDNVKSQLSDQQLERWPKLERAIRRDKMLHLGEISGESVDLLVLVKQLQLNKDTTKSIEPALDEFEIALDEALLARDAAMRAQQEQIRNAMVNMDFDSGGAAIERIMANRVIVRDAQDNGAAAIAAALPANHREEFLTKWRETGYAKVYRASGSDRMFDSARSIEGISAEQKTAIDAAELTYREAVAALQEEMVALIRIEEPKEARRKVESMRARQAGGTPPPRDDQKMQAFSARRDLLAEEARAAIEAILTPEQYAQLSVAGTKLRGAKAAEALGGGEAPSISGDDEVKPQRSGGGRTPMSGSGRDGDAPAGGGSKPQQKSAD